MSSKPRAHSRDPSNSRANQKQPELAPPAPLPSPIDSLIGRERDVEAVVGLLLQDDVRLVTLTGPGGVGKSRLALAAAAEVYPCFADGVRLVRLAAIADPDLVLPTIVSTLGLRDVAGSSALVSLQAALRDRELLLILDNFEQVIAAGADVADLLRACPGLKALVTSRARLRVRGEHVIPVLPLAAPEDDVVADMKSLLTYPAVELFVQRGRELRSDLMRTPADIAAAAAICRRLDGLPLAIELAAARVDILPPPMLLDRLRQPLPLLVGGARDLPDRLRTMRDAIAWSYDLLRPSEQVFFRRLGVFAGGCTLDAAEAVAKPSEPFSALDGIAALLDASLLQREVQDGEPRYTMLETIRVFAQERMIESGEEAANRDRHAHFFRDMADRSHLRIFETADPMLLGMIDREHDNMRAALAWSRDTGDQDTLLRLAGTLAFFWYYRGHLNEAQHWLTQALQTPANDDAPWPRAWALAASGMLANVCGEPERATDLLTESFRWWEMTDDTYGRAIAASMLGGVFVSQGRYDEAAALFAPNEAYYRKANHDNLLGHALFHLGAIAWTRGDEGRARLLLREAVECQEHSGAPADTIDPLRYLGLLACAAGDYLEAANWFDQELTRLRELGSRAACAVGLADVATLAAARKAWRLATRLFAKAEALLQAEGAAFSLPARDHYERAQERVRLALDNVAHGEAAAAGRALTLEQALAVAEAALRGEQGIGAEAPSGLVAAPPSSPFTEREQDVLRLLMAGKSNPEIAEALFIGRGTVRTHVSNILGKLGAKTRTEAAALAHERGLI